MALIVPNGGEVIALQAMLGKRPADVVHTLCLYENNVTPGESDTVVTYTTATFSGYASEEVSADDWTITAGAPSSAACVQKSFTSDAAQSAQSIYGYFLVEASSGDLVYAERFSSTPTIENNGDAIRVTMNITAT